MTDPAPSPHAQPDAPAQPATTQVHPLAALQEAAYDNEVARNRRLLLANDIHTLTRMVSDRDARIKELETELASRTPVEPSKEGE